MYPVPLYTVVRQVTNLQLWEFSPHSTDATFNWTSPNPSIDKFHVKWWIDGQQVQETYTNIPAFTIKDLMPGCRYSFQVACVDSMERIGIHSEVQRFKTVHKPPSQLTVSPGLQNPSTSFLIKYHDEHPTGVYEVSVTNLLDGKTKAVKTEQLFVSVDNLLPGAPYTVAVVSTKNGIMSKSCRIDIPKQTCPEGVSGLQSERASATSQTISWGNVFGADSYSFQWRRMDGNFQTVPVMDTQLTLSNLDSGQVYEVRVTAVNTGGSGEISEPYRFSTEFAAPDAVTAHVDYYGEDISAEVSFVAGREQEVKEYVVALTQDESNIEGDAERPPKLKRVLTTHAAFSKLDHGTSYIPSVIAIGQNGIESRKAFGNKIWTRPAVVLKPRSNPISANAEHIRWKQVVGALSYVVAIQEEGKGKESEREMMENQITLENLPPNTKFAVSIAGKNQGGIGTFSVPHTFQTGLARPDNVVVKNHPKYCESGIIATWDDCDGAAQYNVDIIDIKTNTKADQQTAKKSHKEFLKNLKSGHEYKVTVQAIASDGRSSAVSYSENIWTKCSQVKDLKAKLVSPSMADITWGISEDAEKYQMICRSSDGVPIEEITRANHLTLKNLKLGELYTVSVLPWNKAGFGRESDAVTFRTKWAPVTEVKISNITKDSVKITFSEPDTKPPNYCVLVESTSLNQDLPARVVERNYCAVTGLKVGSEYVACVWSMDPEDPNLDSEKACSSNFITPPANVDGINITMDSPTSRIVTWRASTGSTSYWLKLKKTGEKPILLPETDECEFHLNNLALHSKYSVSVFAGNDGGKSMESTAFHFETGLHPPNGIHVSNDAEYPTTTLNVKVEEPECPAHKYQLRIIHLNGDADEIVKITRQDATSIKRLGGMKPGKSYQLAISSLHEEDDSLNSQEIFSDVIQTKTPPMTFELLKVAYDERRVRWSRILRSTGYIVEYRTQFGDWQTKHFESHICETVLKKLEGGQVYEIKVTATNSAGLGEESPIQTFATAPSTPTGLQARVISTRSVQFWCDETKGASDYNFKINGEDHWTKFHIHVHEHDDESVEFEVSVFASNDGGCSLPSAAMDCSQTLLKLQKKFLTKARNNNDGFIMPVLTEVPSGNEVTDFEREEFSIGAGRTVCIQGTGFSGKTSIGLHYLQSLPENLLGIFLDCEHYKNTASSCDVKSILWQQMKEFQEHERKFAFEWMKSHSDQVVLVVDNLVLPHKVSGKVIAYEDIVSQEEIFYSLVTTDRQLFPQSQVFCLTSQCDLRQIVKPNRAMMVYGFDEAQIEDMKTMILGKKKEVILPKHLKYFCRNPSYCKLIFLLLKNRDQNVDMQSYSSIMIKLVTDSVSCYPDGKKKERLSDLWKEIQSVPQKVKTENIDPSKLPKKSKSRPALSGVSVGFPDRSPSQLSDVPSFVEIQEENAQKRHSSTNLHDYIVKALYFGLSCPLDEFKKRFHRKSIRLGRNANIWILAAGLLREQTMNLAVELFRFVGKTVDVKEMKKKLSFVKSFVADNIACIQEQVVSDSQISLDWLNIINEVEGLRTIGKSKWKISIKAKRSSEEIFQMANFLFQIRGIFFSHIRVKLDKELPPEQRIPIETAMKDNPDGQIQQDHFGSESNFTHNVHNSSFRSTGAEIGISKIPALDSPISDVDDDESDCVFADALGESHSDGKASESSPREAHQLEKGSQPLLNYDEAGAASRQKNPKKPEPQDE